MRPLAISIQQSLSQSQIVTPKTSAPPSSPQARAKARKTDDVSKFDHFIKIGRSGREEDVDFLMKELIRDRNMATTKLIDFVLGLVKTRKGVDRIRHYLFNGEKMQRNYAALFYKRLGDQEVLQEAYEAGKIDKLQAFSR